MKNKESGALPPNNLNGSNWPGKSCCSCGRKQWLSRRDIAAEYSLNSKTIQRLEQAGKLVPSVIDAPAKNRKASGERKPRIKLYLREHLEALLYAGFVSLRALGTEEEVTI